MGNFVCSSADGGKLAYDDRSCVSDFSLFVAIWPSHLACDKLDGVHSYLSPALTMDLRILYDTAGLVLKDYRAERDKSEQPALSFF